MPDITFYANINSESTNTYHNNTPIGANDTRTEVTVEKTGFAGTGATRCRTTLKNISDGDIVLDALSSVYVTGIGRGGKTPVEDRFTVHFAHTVWQGEGQWRHMTLGEAGGYGTYNHDTHTTFRLSSTGSWSTSMYEPFFMIEDKELGETWYFEIETGTGWYMDVSLAGFKEDLFLNVMLSAAFEGNDGWYRTLKPGEEYTTCPCAFGVVKGGFEEAVGEMTVYRRAIMKRHPVKWLPPLCFNDYMDCLWALPTREKTIPLVDAAAELGCEYYVMDAGWFGTTGNWGIDLGDWTPNDSLFGPEGLQGIADYIIQKGMKPGIWLEIESCGVNSPFAAAHPGFLLRRHGKIIGGGRAFLDFRRAEVCDYIMSCFDRLYKMGYRYIKNDYNQTTGIGIDALDGEEGDNGLAFYLGEHDRAFKKFLDDVNSRYPDMIIENCGSGAMRADMDTLSHFWLQSVSDQEDYFRMPSLIAGSQACIPPETCGIWAYPYPTMIEERESFRPTPEFTARFADGRETAYNMVSAIMGLMYLSGHIDCADSYNKTLLRKACDIYRKYRENIACSVPVYPDGTVSMYAKGIYSYGLLDRSAGKMLLAVWSTGSDCLSKTIDLSKYFTAPTVETQYPDLGAGVSYKLEGCELKVTLPAEKTAALFVVAGMA